MAHLAPAASITAAGTSRTGRFDDDAFRRLFPLSGRIRTAHRRRRVLEGLFEIGRIAAIKVGRGQVARGFDGIPRDRVLPESVRGTRPRDRNGGIRYAASLRRRIMADGVITPQIADAQSEAVHLAIEKFDQGCFERSGNPDAFAYFFKLIFRHILLVLRREGARAAKHDPRGTDALGAE